MTYRLRPMFYRLDGRIPTPCADEEYLADVEQRHGQPVRVAGDMIGGAWVSTVFLCFDTACEGPPMVFETMAFDEKEAVLFQERCATWEEAEAMHAAVCEIMRAKMN